MKKLLVKRCISIVLFICFIIIIFWTEGFGLTKRYQYGKTIESSLNFYYSHRMTDVGLNKIISIEDISENRKLVFYETNKDTLMVGLVKKKWNNKWIVVGQGGNIPLDISSIEESEDPTQYNTLYWLWSNLNEFGITVGLIYDKNVESVTVSDKEAKLLNKYTDRYIFYTTDTTGATSTDLKDIMDVKAYDKNNNKIYSYYPLQ